MILKFNFYGAFIDLVYVHHFDFIFWKKAQCKNIAVRSRTASVGLPNSQGQ